MQLRLVTETFMLRDATFSSSTVLILYNCSWNYTQLTEQTLPGQAEPSTLPSFHHSTNQVYPSALLHADKLGRTPIRDNTLAFCLIGVKYTEDSVAGVLDEPCSQPTTSQLDSRTSPPLYTGWNRIVAWRASMATPLYGLSCVKFV